MEKCNCCQDEGSVYVDGVAMLCPECYGNPNCKKCGRNWIALRADGVCGECHEAMREDHELGRREERMIANDPAQRTPGKTTKED